MWLTCICCSSRQSLRAKTWSAVSTANVSEGEYSIHPHISLAQPRSKIHHSKKNFKLLQNDPGTGRIFSQPPLISLKRDKNIGNYLVRSAFQTSDQPGTFKCARAECKTFPFILQRWEYCRDPSDPLRSLIILPVPQPMSSTVWLALFAKKKFTSAKQGDD